MSKALHEYLKTVLPEDHIRMEEPMDRHTTFRVGGPAECFVTVDTTEQLKKVLTYLQLTGWEYFLLGNGSNLVVGDKGYRGVVITLGGDFVKVERIGQRIRAGAGALMGSVAQEALRGSLTGFEFAAGIPGTIGGGVRMNAGAYGGEMAQVVEEVEVMSADGEVLVLDNATMEFAYRQSAIKDRPYVVLSVVLKLNQGNSEEILSVMQNLAQQRRDKQPLELPSAGSTFKRPEGQFAGKLIQDAGLRGHRHGGAQISEKHCGFIVNCGGATAADIKELIEETKETVAKSSGIVLEPEVIFLGEE